MSKLLATCGRCKKEYILDDYNSVCLSVPPDREHRHHLHLHTFVDKVCSVCGRDDERLSF